MAAEVNSILALTADHSGITVCHKDEEIDVYGGRGTRGGSMLTTPPGDYGWLGNPYKVGQDGDRRVVIAKFVRSFYAKLERDPEFREEVKALDGKRVGCWCRHSDEDAPHCHLDVVNEFLRGGRLYVRRFLTQELGAVPDGDEVVLLR